MGRMIDILRTADRRTEPDRTPDLELDALADAEPIEETPTPEVALDAADPAEDDATVPFIEVGGPREPGLRLISPPSPRFGGEGPGVRGLLPLEDLPSPPGDPLRGYPAPQSGERGEEPALFTIRFQPVHAA